MINHNYNNRSYKYNCVAHLEYRTIGEQTLTRVCFSKMSIVCFVMKNLKKPKTTTKSMWNLESGSDRGAMWNQVECKYRYRRAM